MRISSAVVTGLFLLFDFFVVIPVSSIESKESNIYWCHKIEDLNVLNIQKLYRMGNCTEKYDFVNYCMHAMMTDANRNELIYYFKHQSVLLQLGACPMCRNQNRRYNNIQLMTYNWYLEYAAYYLIMVNFSCAFSMNIYLQPEDFPRTASSDIHPGSLPNIYESEHYFAATYINLGHTGNLTPVTPRTGMLSMLNKMEGKDLLRLWNESDYRIGSATHFGCAFFVRVFLESNENYGIRFAEQVYHLVCIFTAKDKLYSTIGRKFDCGNFESKLVVSYYHAPPAAATLCLHKDIEDAEEEACDKPCQGWYQLASINPNNIPLPYEMEGCYYFYPNYHPNSISQPNPQRLKREENASVDYEYIVTLYKTDPEKSILIPVVPGGIVKYYNASGKCVWSRKYVTGPPLSTTTDKNESLLIKSKIDDKTKDNYDSYSILSEVLQDIFFSILLLAVIVLILFLAYRSTNAHR